MSRDDPLGRAIYDFHRGERDEPLVDRDGTATREQPIAQFYFEARDPDREDARWEASWLFGPALDIGAGAGRDTLYFQDQFETVAVEVSQRLVDTMCERGVRDARLGDMFELRADFERDRFRSAFAFGTQVGLAGSMQGLREFLGDLAFVTTPDATALLHGYDPEREATKEILGYRADPTPGLAHRVYHTEYKQEKETMLFRLFSPDRLREAAVGTGWTVAEVRRFSENSNDYVAALEKRQLLRVPSNVSHTAATARETASEKRPIRCSLFGVAQQVSWPAIRSRGQLSGLVLTVLCHPRKTIAVQGVSDAAEKHEQSDDRSNEIRYLGEIQ